MNLRRGFTIIELLIVMVIILIMAGILYPVLAGVKSKANQVKCSGQLRQIGMAIQMYAADHDDFLPIGGYDTYTLPTGFTYPPGFGTQAPNAAPPWRVDWEDSLANGGYLKSYDLLVCPSAPYSDYRYSYGANRHVMGWMGSVRLDVIERPSNTLLITEKGGMDWAAWQPSERANNPYYLPLQMRHLSQLNILFCDGHVGHIGTGEPVEGGSVRWSP